MARLFQSLELPMRVVMKFTDTGGDTTSSLVPLPLEFLTTIKLEIILPQTKHIIYHLISPHTQTRVEFTSKITYMMFSSWVFKRLFEANEPVIKELWIFAYRSTMHNIGPIHLLYSPQDPCHAKRSRPSIRGRVLRITIAETWSRNTRGDTVSSPYNSRYVRAPLRSLAPREVVER